MKVIYHSDNLWNIFAGINGYSYHTDNGFKAYEVVIQKDYGFRRQNIYIKVMCT